MLGVLKIESKTLHQHKDYDSLHCGDQGPGRNISEVRSWLYHFCIIWGSSFDLSGSHFSHVSPESVELVISRAPLITEDLSCTMVPSFYFLKAP